jgi:hypothetical protein
MGDVTVVDFSPVLYLIPAANKEQLVYNSLKGAHPNMTVYLKNEIPGNPFFPCTSFELTSPHHPASSLCFFFC